MPRDEPARPPDPLSDVLHTLQLRGDVYARTEAASPWSIAFPAGEARFHWVERGEIWVQVAGLKKPRRARQGDLLLLPHGAAHTLADRIGRRAAPLLELLKGRNRDEDVVLRVGRGPPDTLLSCGRFFLEPQGRAALLAALPPLLVVSGQAGRPDASLDLVLRLFVVEAHTASPGSSFASARLVELMLVHAIRAWLSEQDEGMGGWLGAMRDAQIGAALAKLHAAPERDWTVQQLAAAVGLSRSPFATRFRALVGEPPLKYLTHWRMQLAAALLRNGQSVREVAERVGYHSDAAFSRSFKKHFGQPPVKLRRTPDARPR